MPILTPVELHLTQPLSAISEKSLADHYKLYCGYVERYNELWSRLEAVRTRGTVTAVVEIESLKVDLTFALGAIKNHEYYFGMLGDQGDEPTGALAEAIRKDFGGIANFLVDLKHTATAARGWAWTVYDLDFKHLFNYPGSAQSAMPVPNVVPIIAIDLYGHAYFYDFGHNKTAYIEALLQDIGWQTVGTRFEKAREMG